MGRYTGSGRAWLLAMLGLCLAAVACQKPAVGAKAVVAAPSEGPRIAFEDGWIDLHGHVVATFSVNENDVPLVLAEVKGLEPRFTLARLTSHPADGQRGWESLLPTGDHVVPALAPGGPDDPNVLTSVRQPGSESSGQLVDLGEGQFRYVFAQAVQSFAPDETIRVGVWLEGVEHATPTTSATYDFSPSSGIVEKRDTVRDENCVGCHGPNHLAHEKRSGIRLCLTCHTWQAADPYTVDPAAIFAAGTTPATNPNPLELGRLVHRIHRGKELPTLYQTAWDGVSPTTVPSPTGLPNPYIPYRPYNPTRSPMPGRKFSVVRSDGSEKIYGAAAILYPVDPSFVGSMLLATGGLFPRDLRDCAACHADAPQGWVVKFGITRRTCSGCHPEVWYQASSPAADRVRFPHPGGPQSNDGGCAGCHVDGTNKLYAPIEEIHVPPARSPRYDKPVVEIVRVDDLAPGKRPRVTFRLYDRVGPIAPSPSAPVPAFEPDQPGSSYVPRKFAAGSILIKIQGPTVPDYMTYSGVTINSGAAGGNPDPVVLTTGSGTDEYVYTFGSTIPPGAAGSYIIGFETRRGLAAAPPYDKASDVFRWPYTHEPVNETGDNVWVFVNSASGAWPPPAGTPAPVPRRTVVDLQKCLRCHDRIEFHGPARHDVNWCVTCHNAELADIDKRINNAGRRYPGGPVRIGGTYDGLEERSTHLKMHLHRLHTGNRTGVASLEGIAPYVVYFGKAYFFDRGGFPNDLANCTLCHLGKSYLLESVPADAPATRANETATVWHPDGSLPHPPGEPAILPLQAACTGCHATGATFAHVAAKTVDGVETCAQCHVKGPVAVEVAHGLAPATGGGASARFSSIVSTILEPRCASAACHAPGATPPRLDAGGAYGALVGAPSGQSSLLYVKPNEPDASYLVHKLRGTAGSVGGSVVTLMPTDGALAPADIAAIEAWIANGAPND